MPIAVALAQSRVAGWLERYPPDPTTSATFRDETRTWLVKVWSGEAGQIAQAVVQDTTETVSDVRTGPQVAWGMARGGEGSFGGKTLLKPYVWLAFCLVFFVGLADLRRPFSLRNVDLLVLLSFSVSLAFFGRGDIFTSVPLVYPVLGYLLARSAWVGIRKRQGELRPVWPTWVFAAAAIFLLGFRVGLNVEAPRGVIDVGLAGVVGATRILDGEAPYGNMPQRGDLEECGPKDADGDVRERIQTNGRCEAAIERGDTYGPVAYVAYVPATLVFAWSGKWDSLPGAHATSILFDLLAILGLGLVGLRFGGVRLAAMLAFAWCAYPFTAYTLNANTNDTIMPAFLVFGFWLASSTWARGTAVALAGWTKFGGLLLAPLWASYPTLELRRLVRFALAFALATLVSFVILLLEPGSSGGDSHVLEPHRRLPGRTRLPVLALGLGPVPRGGNPGPRVPAAGRRRVRRGSGGRARVRAAGEGPDRARRADGVDPGRVPALADPLVLPLSALVLALRAALAPAAARTGGSAERDAKSFDRRRLARLGVAVDHGAFDPHVSLSRLEAHREPGAHAPDRELGLDPDHRVVRSGHTRVGDECGAVREDARVRGLDVRVGPDDRGHPAVEPARERDLLARRLGMHVDKYERRLRDRIVDELVDDLEHRGRGIEEQ